MIELDKKDVAGIARRRFMNQYGKYLYIGLFGMIAVMIGASFAMPESAREGMSWQMITLGVVVMAVLFGGMVWWQRWENRVVATFVKEVEENGVSYKPETVKGIVAHSE